MPYHYKIYGIHVISEIVLPALINGSPDDTSLQTVYIKQGLVPATLENPSHGQTNFSVFNENECLTHIPDVARL